MQQIYRKDYWQRSHQVHTGHRLLVTQVYSVDFTEVK
jgi:hypothetical protein